MQELSETKEQVKIQANVKLTPDQLAEAFCELTDDQMALFFEAVGGIAKTWDHGGSMQWYNTGQHMKTCACVTFEGRNVIETIYEVMK